MPYRVSEVGASISSAEQAESLIEGEILPPNQSENVMFRWYRASLSGPAPRETIRYVSSRQNKIVNISVGGELCCREKS